MKRIYLIHKPRIITDKEHHNTALYEIELANLVRLRMMLVIVFIIEVLFIVFNDIPYYLHLSTRIIWNNSSYFVLHLLLLVTSVIGFFGANKLICLAKGKWNQVYSYYTPAILIVYLILVSLLNGLDQLNSNNISSIFMANLLICGGIFILKFPKNFFTYAIPFLCHIGTFIYLGFEAHVLFSNLINGLILLFAVVIISNTIYNYQYEGIVKNISLDQTNKQLNYLSSHDPLTGLLNRRCFMEQIEKKQEGKTQSAAIILVDIDFFKNVNDMYGHPAGDIVLKEVSSVLMKYIKEEDLAVRWGGEEFLLFLYSASAEEAYVLAEIIRKSIEELTIEVDEFKIQITASFGIAPIDYENDLMFSVAYKAADIALYQAKEQGRNRVVKATVSEK